MSASTSPEGNPSNHSSAQILQRMIGDMKIRHLSPRTINSYCRQARLFAQFIDKPLSEATHLQVADIDSQRMQLKVTHGKGNKMRFVPFSPRLLTELREDWRDFQPTTFLFPGQSSNWPLGQSSIQEAIKVSARKSKITKLVTPHTLRHSYATALLEAGVDLLTISRWLGHASFTTRMIYLHIRRPHLQSAPSPLDWLPVNQIPTWQPTDKEPRNPRLS